MSSVASITMFVEIRSSRRDIAVVVSLMMDRRPGIPYLGLLFKFVPSPLTASTSM